MSGGAPAFATVGTDFHPFDRLLGWIDRLAADGVAGESGWLVQHGATAAPLHAAGQPFLDNDALQEAFANASFVVAHGGPATVTEARRHGHLPIVVPRDPAYGEHVDDHQLRFTRKMHAQQLVHACETEQEFRDAVALALADPAAFRLSQGVDDERVAATVRHFAELVDPLVAPAASAGPTVLFLGGFGRSGSTLVERLLGEADGVCVLGEVVHLWERGLLGDERCGCSLAFSQCPQWQRIGQVAFGGWDKVDGARVLELKSRVDRNRFIPMVAGWRLSSRFRKELREYVDLYQRVYAAAAEVTGARVVVDSSKHASLAFCLSRSTLDLRVVHVVRDSPGVTYSWSKQVKRPEAVAAGNAFMPRYSAAKAAMLWNSYNLLFELLRVRRTPLQRIGYEQLIAAPQQTLLAVAEFAGIDTESLPDVTDGSVQMAASHSVAGNPMRFTNGTIKISSDDSWRTQMPRRSRLVVTLVTAPLRVWYGYGPGRLGHHG